ncbi:biopolymer transporter ExbD [candidate division WOR-3 bacterium]|nr:biopolymer transporter ExbD [candidate division WOR-3 bacterium]MCK4574968.1 biopolymer transporter ExbD [candidate division WOR-3 bacterium]
MKRRFPKPEVELERPEVPIAPTINVALLLVLFFMMSAPMMYHSGITISAPSLKKAGEQKKETEVKVNIHITEEGKILLNNEFVEEEVFPQLLAELLARSTSRIVIVSADGNVPHQSVVTILDLAKQKGAMKLALLKRKKRRK